MAWSLWRHNFPKARKTLRDFRQSARLTIAAWSTMRRGRSIDDLSNGQAALYKCTSEGNTPSHISHILSINPICVIMIIDWLGDHLLWGWIMAWWMARMTTNDVEIIRWGNKRGSRKYSKFMVHQLVGELHDLGWWCKQPEGSWLAPVATLSLK